MKYAGLGRIVCLTFAAGVFAVIPPMAVAADDAKSADAHAGGSQPGKSDSDSFVPKEEWKRIAPVSDEAGAKWKVRVVPTSRKEQLLGRPLCWTKSGITISDNFVFYRNPANGSVLSVQPIIPAVQLLQIVNVPRRMAFSATPKYASGAPPGEIIYLDETSAWSVCTPADLKAWPTKITVPFGGAWMNTAKLTLSGHTQPPWRILFAPEFPVKPFGRLVSCSDDGTIRLWDLDAQSEVPQIDASGKATRANQSFGKQTAEFPCYKPDANGQVTRGEFAAFSPYGHWLATAYQHRVDFRSPRDGRSEFSWEPDLPESRRIMALRFDDNGNTLFAFLENAAATKTREVKFFQYDIDERQAQPFIGMHGVVDGRMIGDGQYIVTWDGSPEIVVWDVAERKEAASLKVAPQHLYDLAISPNGDVIATAGDDGTVKFWKSPSGEQPEPKPLETKSTFRHDGVDLVQLSGDGKWLFTGSDDGWLKTWDAPEFCRDHGTRPIATSIGPGGNVTEKFPDGSLRTSKKQ